MGVEFRLLLKRSNKNKKVVNEKENLDELGFILKQLPFPGNGARKLVGYFERTQKNPQAYEYRCSFHPRVFQGIDFPWGT